MRNIRQVIEDNYKVEGDLRRQVQLNIKRLKDLGCYQAFVIVAVCLFAVSERRPCQDAQGSRRTVTKKKK